MIKIIFVYIIIFLLLNCSKPPEKAILLDFLETLNQAIPVFNKIKNNREEQEKLIKEQEKKNEIIVLKKNSKIKAYSITKLINDFFYSIEDNKFLVKKELYVTFSGFTMYISEDRENWIEINLLLVLPFFSFNLNNIKSDNFKPGEKKDFISDFYIESKYYKDKNILDLIYSFSIIPSKNILLKKVQKNNAKIFNLEKNFIIADSKNNHKNVTIDLQKDILKTPKDTIIDVRFFVTGNVLSLEKENNYIALTAKKDIYFYSNAKTKLFGISFDNKDWNITILDFSFKTDFLIESVSNNEIQINFYFNLNFNK